MGKKSGYYSGADAMANWEMNKPDEAFAPVVLPVSQKNISEEPAKKNAAENSSPVAKYRQKLLFEKDKDSKIER